MLNTRSTLLTALITAMCSLTSCQPTTSNSQLDEAWNQLNDPALFGVYAARPFHQIPRSSRLAQLPWSDYYWSTFRGGISYRWQFPSTSVDYRSYLYEIPTPAWVHSLSRESIAHLSPSEKYDIAFGRMDFPLTRSERQRTLTSVTNGKIPTWFGLCHGWAPASIEEQEPIAPVAVKGLTGQSVTFYPSDLRALLTKAYADAGNQLRPRQLGQRCDDPAPLSERNGRRVESRCRDTNPGAFHLIVADLIAHKKQSFIADVAPTDEVWNQPITGYAFQYENLRPFTNADPLAVVRARRTVQLVDVRLKLEYAKERAPSSYHHGMVAGTALYNYTLELDAEGNILGGEWLSNIYPDFLWQISSRPQGEVGGINVDWVRRMVQYSRKNQNAPSPAHPTAPSPQRYSPPPHSIPTSTMAVDFVSVGYRGVDQATATVWANIFASPSSSIRAYVIYGDGRQLVFDDRVQNSERFMFSFNYARAGANGYYFELIDERGTVIAGETRKIP